jgi:ribosomal protein S18 acetylase RimI-like enzyme
MPTPTGVRADALAPGRLHQAFAEAFADYLIGAFNLPLAQWPVFLARHGVDLALSRVQLAGEAVQAFALVAPRPSIGSWRLAVMGAAPAERGSGAAAALLDDFIRRAGAAGMRQAELECFAQNERAIRLYRGRGFEAVHALHGYARPAGLALDRPQVGDPHEDVALASAWAWLDELSAARGDLPLQVTGESLRAQATVPQAWRRGTAQLVFLPADAATIQVQSLVDTDPAQQDAESLVAQLVAAFPERRIAVPQLQRADLGGDALLRLGFERLPLHQWLMRRPL